MTASFNFGGIDMSTKGMYIVNQSITAMGKFMTYEQKVIGRKGMYDFLPELSGREIQLDCIIFGTSNADLNSKIDDINAIFDPLLGSQQLILDTQTDRYFLCRLAKEPSIAYAAFEAAMQLSFLCPDAYSYALTPTVENKTGASFSITVGGNAEANPVYEITADNSSTGNVKLKNTTLNKELTWNGTWVATKVLKIDCVNWIVYYDNAVSMLGVSGEFPMLKGGVANSFTLSGMTGDTKITYNGRYI